MKPHFPLLIAALLVACAPAYAENPLCGPQKTASKMFVEIKAKPVSINHVMSRAKLKSFDVDSKSPFVETNQNLIHVNGLMRGTIDLKTNIAIAWQRTAGNEMNCLWYQNAEVTMSLDPIIYIAREIPQGSCLYGEVLKHEMRHLETDMEVMEDYRLILQDRIDWFLKQAEVEGPYRIDVVPHARKSMSAKFDRLIKDVHIQLQAERIRRQGAIDTLEEYSRVAKICPNDAGLM